MNIVFFVSKFLRTEFNQAKKNTDAGTVAVTLEKVVKVQLNKMHEIGNITISKKTQGMLLCIANKRLQ